MSRSSRNSPTDLSMRARTAGETSSPCSISQAWLLLRTGNELINPASTP